MAIETRRELGAPIEELVSPGNLEIVGAFKLVTTDTTAADPTYDAPDIWFQIKGADGSIYVVPGYDAT